MTPLPRWHFPSFGHLVIEIHGHRTVRLSRYLTWSGQFTDLLAGTGYECLPGDRESHVGPELVLEIHMLKAARNHWFFHGSTAFRTWSLSTREMRSIGKFFRRRWNILSALPTWQTQSLLVFFQKVVILGSRLAIFSISSGRLGRFVLKI